MQRTGKKKGEESVVHPTREEGHSVCLSAEGGCLDLLVQFHWNSFESRDHRTASHCLGTSHGYSVRCGVVQRSYHCDFHDWIAVVALVATFVFGPGQRQMTDVEMWCLSVAGEECSQGRHMRTIFDQWLAEWLQFRCQAPAQFYKDCTDHPS